MEPNSNGSISRGTFSKFFKRTCSASSGNEDLPQTPSSHKARKIGTLFTKDDSKSSLPQSEELIASSSASSPTSTTTPMTPITPRTPIKANSATSATPATPITPATPATSRSSATGTPKGRRRGTVLEAIGNKPEELGPRSFFDDDTEDEDYKKTLRSRVICKVKDGFKPRTKVNIEEKKGLSEVEAPIKMHQPELHTELQQREHIEVPTTVFKRDTLCKSGYDENDEIDFTGTFHFFKAFNNEYVRPGRNDVLHIREDGREYITIERINGVCSITAGVFECVIAELANPVLTPHDLHNLFDNLIFCGSMLVGNVTMLRTVFDQLKASVGNSAQELNLVHFIIHWIREKPEDFSWCNEVLELRFQIFRYALDTFKKTLLSRNLYSASVRHHRLEGYYKRFARKQKKGWVSFQDMKLSYTRHTECDLIPVGLSNINVDDLTNYFSLIDLILFRDGCEMSTLDLYWKEQAQMDIPCEYLSENYFYERRVPYWWPVERVERILERQRMIKHWIAVEVMQLDTLASRIQMIRVFISVAWNLLELSDFHGVFCIMEGLECPMVRHLNGCWEGLGHHYLGLFEQLGKIVNDKEFYHKCLEAKSDNPVIPYYVHFLDEVTDIRNSKDHSERIKLTGTTKMHLDAPLEKFGVWDTADRKAPITISEDDVLQTPVSLDLQKYRKLLTTVQGYQKRAQPEYQHCGEITMACFALRLHLVGIKGYINLTEISDLTSPQFRGRLDETSQLIETRILESWSLQPKNNIPPEYRDGDATRCLVLQNLQKALVECT